jgi:bifunctional non-homologous end joining protein LigD
MDLKKYWAKRNFKKTSEPAGKVKKSKSTKKLFIIQKHAASHLHYDFRLELGGVLLSWAVPKGPCLDPQVKRLAMHVEDHPLEYGSFEGTIPKGEYGGGTVMLWDKGVWIPIDEDPVAAYKKGNLKFILKAKKLQGAWKLIRIRHDDKTWLLIKVKDEAAKTLKAYDVTQEEPLSVISNLDLDEIANKSKKVWHSDKASKKKTPTKKKRNSSRVKAAKITVDLPKAAFPTKIAPQLATLVDKPPEGEEWIHEIKFDGYRFLAFKKNKIIKLISRNGKDWSDKFPTIVNAICLLPYANLIFDGEIVVLDKDNKSDFQLLQNAIKEGSEDFYYYVFDLLYYDRFSLAKLPLIERKTILKQIVPDKTNNILLYSDHIYSGGKSLLKHACEMSLEGIVSKQANRPYYPGRSKEWVKSKCVKRQEFVIGGFTAPQNTRKYFGALLLGTFDDNNKLLYHGNVGTGFNEKLLKDIHNQLSKLSTDKCPFSVKPKGLKSPTWVNPVLVAEIEFTEWTSENNLRHPSFKGMRLDKKARGIRREIDTPVQEIMENHKSPSPQKPKSKVTFKITNPDKVLYPEDKITKGQIADYYQMVSAWILPYVSNRPLTLLRCPEGYQKCFYQKHLKDETLGLYTFPIKEKAKVEEGIYINDIDGLKALCQMGVLEIHSWGSHVDNIEKPDFIVFDLDPAPEVAWVEVVNTAREIKKHLQQFGLKSFVKTTGGKGLHVVIPIKPEYDWDTIKNFSHVFVDFMVANNPTKYVSKMSKQLRKGKIFIDYLRNQRGATAISPYSTRARIHAPVSVPLAWEELTKNRKDTAYTIKTLEKRLDKLKKDPWQDFYKIKQSLQLDKL